MDSQGGVDVLLVGSCCRNWDELWPVGSLGSYAEFMLAALLVIKGFSKNCIVYFEEKQ